MRFARIAAILALIVVLVVGGLAALIASNQARIVTYVLASVRKRTGVDIIPRASTVHLGTHLNVLLDEPEVIFNGQKIVKLKSLRAIVTYRSILTGTGLPLYRLTATNPEITLPVIASNASAVPVPRPDADLVRSLTEISRTLTRITWRFDTIDASVRYADGTPVLDQLGIVAFRTRRDPYLWRIGLDTAMVAAPTPGAHMSARLSIGNGARMPPDHLANGQVWIWDVPLNRLAAEGFKLAGETKALLKFGLLSDGSITGKLEADAQHLALKGQRLSSPIVMGDYSLKAGFSMSNGMYSISQITLRRVDIPVFSADTELRAPLSGNPELGVRLGGFNIDAAGLKQELLSVRRLPADFIELLGRIKPGQVNVGGATLSAALSQIRTEPLATIRRNLVVSASIADAGFTMPPDTKLPSIENISAQLRYEKGVLTISQASAKIGNSIVRDLHARAHLLNGFDGAPYDANLDIDADLKELSPAIFRTFDIYKLKDRERIESLAGRIDLNVTGSGVLSVEQLVLPTDYLIKANPNGAIIAVKGPPGPLQVRRGAIAITPSSIKFTDLILAATGGDATLDGAIDFVNHGYALKDLTLSLHQFPSELWTALVIDPADLAVRGPIGGKVVLNTDPLNPDIPSPEGKLTLASGEVQFNFLRAPIMVQGATLTMHRKSVILNMPGSKLEGQPIDFKVSVADYSKPSIRIDANVQKMDLEVMEFIRMPWSPAAPPIHLPVPASGHIEARSGNLAAFQMTDMKTDFVRQPNGDWRVYNLSATAYRGKLNLELVGRAPDNWIQMKGNVADMDPAPLFMLGGKNKHSPLLGHLFLAADLFGNTDTDFFNTLAGDMSITIRDGTLDKFTLLSRLLSFIDIKNWLSAQIPDPRVSGVPFKSILADFKGEKGRFYTDNFLLHGPVMDITATGSIQFGDSTLDMQIGMFPFDTVDWVLNKIPLIGERIGAGTGKLLAAYFQVQGPVSDPSILPKPITSVAEFVKRTLGMPINLIRPNTIK